MVFKAAAATDFVTDFRKNVCLVFSTDRILTSPHILLPTKQKLFFPLSFFKCSMQAREMKTCKQLVIQEKTKF